MPSTLVKSQRVIHGWKWKPVGYVFRHRQCSLMTNRRLAVSLLENRRLSSAIRFSFRCQRCSFTSCHQRFMNNHIEIMHSAIKIISQTVSQSPSLTDSPVLQCSCDVSTEEGVSSSPGFSVDLTSLQLSDESSGPSLGCDSYYICENGGSGNQHVGSVTMATAGGCATGNERSICRKSDEDLIPHLPKDGRVDGSIAKVDRQQVSSYKSDVEEGLMETSALQASSYRYDIPSTDLINNRWNRQIRDRIGIVDVNSNFKLGPRPDIGNSYPSSIPVPSYSLKETVVSSEMSQHSAQVVRADSETESTTSNTLPAVRGSSTVARYTCIMCPLSYKRLADLNRHMRQKHGANLRNAMRWRSLMLDHCKSINHWIVTGSSVEPIDLSTKKTSANKMPSATVVAKLEPLDLSTKIKNSVHLRKTRSSRRKGIHQPIYSASLLSKESAKTGSSYQYHSFMDVELPRSTSHLPDNNAARGNAPCESETPKTLVKFVNKPNNCERNWAAELLDDEVNLTYVANSNSAELSNSMTDGCRGTSKFEVSDISDVKLSPKKYQNTSEAQHRCFVCCLPLKKTDSVLCCYCSTSNFDWQNHIRQQLMNPLVRLTETGHGTEATSVSLSAVWLDPLVPVNETGCSKLNDDEATLMSLSTVCCNNRRVEENFNDAACLLSDPPTDTVKHMRRGVLGEGLMLAIMNKNGTECLTSERFADSLESRGSDIMAAPVNRVLKRYEVADELSAGAAGAAVIGNKFRVMPVSGQRLQSSNGDTKKKKVREVNNDGVESQRLSNSRSPYADCEQTKCGTYGRDLNNNWSCNSTDYLNTSPGQKCGTSSADDKEGLVFSTAYPTSGHMSIGIKINDNLITPVKCSLSKGNMEHCQPSQMQLASPSLDDSVKMTVPEFQLSASWTVSSRRLKRFCCSACPYRSNFRSDVVRHIRHKHPDVGSAQIFVMNAEDAAATLADYLNTWAKKKFVLVSRNRQTGKRKKGSNVSVSKSATVHSRSYSDPIVVPTNMSIELSSEMRVSSSSPLSTSGIDLNTDAVDISEFRMESNACAIENTNKVSEYSLKCVSMSNIDELVVGDLALDARPDVPYRNTITVMSPTRSCHDHPVGGASSRYRCRYCPYISRNRNDYLHHQLFHQECPSTVYMFPCELCEYEASEKCLLHHHYEVRHCISSRLPVIPHASPMVLTTNPERHDAIGVDAELNEAVLPNCSDAEGSDRKKLWPITPSTSSKNPSISSLVWDNVDDWNGSTTKQSPTSIVKSAGDGDGYKSVIVSKRRKWWRCDRCAYITSKRSQLAYHVKQHGAEQRLQCVHCNYSVSGYHFLMQHIRLHSSQPRLNQTSPP